MKKKHYEYAVHQKCNFEHFYFVKAKDVRQAIKIAFDEYFNNFYHGTIIKTDLRAIRATK
jgi:hypothetical protein